MRLNSTSNRTKCADIFPSFVTHYLSVVNAKSRTSLSLAFVALLATFQKYWLRNLHTNLEWQFLLLFPLQRHSWLTTTVLRQSRQTFSRVVLSVALLTSATTSSSCGRSVRSQLEPLFGQPGLGWPVGCFRTKLYSIAHFAIADLQCALAFGLFGGRSFALPERKKKKTEVHRLQNYLFVFPGYWHA